MEAEAELAHLTPTLGLSPSSPPALAPPTSLPLLLPEHSPLCPSPSLPLWLVTQRRQNQQLSLTTSSSVFSRTSTSTSILVLSLKRKSSSTQRTYLVVTWDMARFLPANQPCEQSEVRWWWPAQLTYQRHLAAFSVPKSHAALHPKQWSGTSRLKGVHASEILGEGQGLSGSNTETKKGESPSLALWPIWIDGSLFSRDRISGLSSPFPSCSLEAVVGGRGTLVCIMSTSSFDWRRVSGGDASARVKW